MTEEYPDYTRGDPWTMDPTPLRAVIRERGHHTIEIQLYEAIAKGEPLAADTGSRVKELLSIWEQRGLPLDYPDLKYVRNLLDMAERAKRGERVDLSQYRWSQFSKEDLEVVNRLVYERRSVRHWSEEEVPDWMIDEILRAGLWAAHGCNLNSIRFLVVREKSHPGLFRGADIPGGPVHLVACQDRRVYNCMSGYTSNPERLETNRLLDCGAALQNMVLMAHALGLGGVWLTFRPAMLARIREQFQLPEHLWIVSYMDVGFPTQTPLPPGRLSLEEAVVVRE